jgi:hypothetical protein
MVTRYFKATQCLNSIPSERSPEALKIADARAGLRPLQGCDSALLETVFSVPDDEFRWFHQTALRLKAEKYETTSRNLQSYWNLFSPLS